MYTRMDIMQHESRSTLWKKHSRDVTNYHVSASAECVPIASVTEQTFSIPDQSGTAL